jgi:predicted nucleic acid-binding protein
MIVRVVVDTSVIVKWLNQTNEDNLEQADKLMAEAIEGKVELIAPELAKYETGNVLLKSKQLLTREATISLGTSYSLPITFIPESEELARETFSIANKSNVTYYDAAFLALAKKYNALLITENIKHQGKVKSVKVKALKDC